MAATRRLKRSVAASNAARPGRTGCQMTDRQVLRLWVALVVPGAVLAVAAHLVAVSALDVAVTTEVQEHRAIDVLLTPLMVAVSLPGNYPWAELLFGFACLVTVSKRDWRTFGFILSAVPGT